MNNNERRASGFEKAGGYVLVALGSIAIGAGAGYAVADVIQSHVALEGGTQALTAAEGNLQHGHNNRFEAATIPESLKQWEYTANHYIIGKDIKIPPHAANQKNTPVTLQKADDYFVFPSEETFASNNRQGAQETDATRTAFVAKWNKRAAIGGGALALLFGEGLYIRHRRNVKPAVASQKERAASEPPIATSHTA